MKSLSYLAPFEGGNYIPLSSLVAVETGLGPLGETGYLYSPLERGGAPANGGGDGVCKAERELNLIFNKIYQKVN